MQTLFTAHADRLVADNVHAVLQEHLRYIEMQVIGCDNHHSLYAVLALAFSFCHIFKVIIDTVVRQSQFDTTGAIALKIAR